MQRHVESIPYEGLNDATHIDVEVYYSKGGVSYLSGQTARRGFYICGRVTTHRDGVVSYTLFSGARQLLLEVSRYSEKQFQKAVLLSEAVKQEIIDYVVRENRAA